MNFDDFRSGWNAALAAVKNKCDHIEGSFRGYPWDNGAGTCGYDKAVREIAQWAETAMQSERARKGDA